MLCFCATAQQRQALVLFVEFNDLKFTYSYSSFQSFTDSLSLYFNDQFHGQTEFNFVRGPVISLNESYIDFGKNTSSHNDDHAYLAVINACRAAAIDSVNFADFSNGSTSEVRDLLVMVPGKSELDTAARELFRPQYVEFASRNSYPYINGRRLVCYGLATEMDSTGTFTGIGHMAHEYSHILGLKDYYDTDGPASGGTSKALWGSLALMDSGNNNNNGHTPPSWCAVDYYTIGAGNPVIIDTAGTYTLEPIHQNGTYFVFKGPDEGEVFLAESRTQQGWDAHIGGQGMLIYHVDRSQGDALWSDWESKNLTAFQRWEANRLNCNPMHPCVQLEAPNDSVAFYPYGEVDGFSSETRPAFRFWDGSLSPLAISDISQGPDGTVSFNLTRPISNMSVTPFQNSLILSWKCDEAISHIDSCTVTCTKGADTLLVRRGVQGDEGTWTCLVEKLAPSTSYRLIVKIFRGGRPFFSGRISAVTLSARANLYPFIYLKGLDYTPSGLIKAGSRMPLQVFNAADAKEIKWYFKGAEASAGADGYYTLNQSGVLKAVVYWEDGSVDVLVKELVVE